MQATVKLTLRIPAGLHEKLWQRARTTERSLNTVLVETIQHGLSEETTYPETERERVIRVLRDSGLWEPQGTEWKKYSESAPKLSYREWREKLSGVPPLSEAIIEEREPR
ncbi:MAG: Arc family DNA-binding protein [Anaerolineales bacterium]|nr:Arc family DNA-binding protein [Anaerolineales bacterium]